MIIEVVNKGKVIWSYSLSFSTYHSYHSALPRKGEHLRIRKQGQWNKKKGYPITTSRYLVDDIIHAITEYKIILLVTLLDEEIGYLK